MAIGGYYIIVIKYHYASRKRILSHRLEGFRCTSSSRVSGEGDGPAIVVRLAEKCADTIKKNAWNKSMREKDRVASESVVYYNNTVYNIYKYTFAFTAVRRIIILGSKKKKKQTNKKF